MQAEHEHSPLNDDEPDQSRFSPVLGENVRRMRSYSNITKTRLALMVSIGRPLLNSEIPCRVSSDPHERRNDLGTVSTRDSVKF